MCVAGGAFSFVADLISRNGGWFALLGLPLAAWGSVATTMQLLDGIRARHVDVSRLPLLASHIRRTRVDLDLRRSIVLDEPLAIRVHGGGLDDCANPIGELYDRLRNGVSFHLIGEAGSGKSTFALCLVEHALRRHKADTTDPLVDVVALRDWRPAHWWERPLRVRDGAKAWQQMLDWIARELQRSHPTFGHREIRRLLLDQRLLVCLDGVDEVPHTTRDELVEGLSAVARVGVPIVALSRESGLDRDREPRRSIAIEDVEPLRLQPIDAGVLEPALTRRAGWQHVLRDAAQPRLVTRALSNPLLLSIALLAWPIGQRPGSLIAASDPVATIWHSYVDRVFVDEHGSRRLKDVAAWIALVSRSRSNVDFHPADVQWHRAARPATVGLCALALAVLIAFHRSGFVTAELVGFTAAALLGLHYGMRPGDEGLVNRLRMRWRLTARLPSLAVYWPLMTVVMQGLIALATAAISLMHTRLLTTSGYESLALHLGDGTAVRAWWRLFGSDEVRASLSWWTIVGAYLPAACAAFMRCDGVDRDLMWFWLPRRLEPSWSIRFLGIVLIAFGVLARNFTTALMGILVCVPLIFAAVSGGLLRLNGEIPRGGIRHACDRLVELGVMHRTGRRYRFRHQEISRLLARSALERLAAARRMRRLPSVASAIGVIDMRAHPEALRATRAITEQLAGAFRRNPIAASARAAYLVAAEQRPVAAERPLRRALRSYPHDSVRAQLAEAVDLRGRPQDAERLWERVLADHPHDPWVLWMWADSRLRRGLPRQAISGLESALRDAPEERAEGIAFTLERLRLRFGTSAERANAHAALERMAESSGMQVDAILELARSELEDERRPEDARRLLRPLVDGDMDDPLARARLAWAEHLAGNDGEARTWMREALDGWSWNADFEQQLELLLLGSLLPGPSRDVARERLQRSLAAGWRLHGRSPAIYLAVAPADDAALVRSAFGEPDAR